MKTAKNARQEMIIKLIKEHDISTQEELTAKVKAAGFEATQATCSRDIKVQRSIISAKIPAKHRHTKSNLNSTAMINTSL